MQKNSFLFILHKIYVVYIIELRYNIKGIIDSIGGEENDYK